MKPSESMENSPSEMIGSSEEKYWDDLKEALFGDPPGLTEIDPDEIAHIGERLDEIAKRADQYYIEHFKGDYNAIMKVIRKHVSETKKEDFIIWNEAFNFSKEHNYNTCVEFFLDYLNLQIKALQYYKFSTDEVLQIVEEKASTFYKKPKNKVNISIENAKLNRFFPMLNGTATNQLTNISTRATPPKIDIITGNATLEQGSIKVLIKNYNALTGGLKVSTSKLLDACTMALTQNNNYRGNDSHINNTVSIPLERYMELCGIQNTKSNKDWIRKKVKEDLDTLFNVSIEWTENSNKKRKDFSEMRICTQVGIVKGNITFSFSPELAKYLVNAYVMQFPVELLKIDERNPSSYHIGRKLLLHHSIDNNKLKGTANLISVKCLLEVCPDIPTYEEVMNGGRQLEQRIKSPFEKALNALPFINWEYANSKGAPLTDEQLAATDYNTFEELYIKFEVIGEPDQTARLERKVQAAAKAEQKKNSTSKSKKTVKATAN